MVMIEEREEYRRFLNTATAALVSGGAQVVLGGATPEGSAVADWAEGWDRILASSQPGNRAIYAFTDAAGATLQQLKERISLLADGIAARDFAQGLPLKLVAIAVYPEGLGALSARSVTRIAPQTFHQRLRPSTWTVDLRSKTVTTSGLLKAPEAKDLERRLGALDGQVIDQHGLGVLEQEQTRRNAAFYQLMRAHQPYVTYLLIAMNVGIFLLMAPNSAGNISIGTLRNFGALSATLVGHGQWWRMFTSVFLHASIVHILFNMVSLFAIGTLAERLYGSRRFLTIYLGAGLIGSLASVLHAMVSGQPEVLGVGASGAIFGVAGALLTLRLQRSDVIPLRLRTQISMSLLPLVAISLVFSFLTPYVDNSAHIGGLLGGAALSFVFPLMKTFPESGVHG